MNNLDRLRELNRTATPGSWFPMIAFTVEGYSTLLLDAINEWTEADQELIKLTRNMLPKFLELVDAAEFTTQMIKDRHVDNYQEDALYKLRVALAALRGEHD